MWDAEGKPCQMLRTKQILSADPNKKLLIKTALEYRNIISETYLLKIWILKKFLYAAGEVKHLSIENWNLHTDAAVNND